MSTAGPNADARAARALGAALRRVGYAEDAVTELLGDDAYEGGRDDVVVNERRLPQTRLATVVRLLFLELPVPERDAERALGRRGVAALAATGLAQVGAAVEPRARLIPVGDLLLASDGLPPSVGTEPPDYVATYTPTSKLCDSLTPRPRVGRALDIGTGNGIHALLAARHAGEVVATDVNPRALAFTELNAAMNGFDNVECRRGSLFEPVGAETFDLVTCNAPFVVSPEHRWTYRDAGLRGDELSKQVVAGAAERLADGGYATILASWIGTDEDDPDERPLEWAGASGCDAWVLSAFASTPLEHAAYWNGHLADDHGALAAALEEWERYFEQLGAATVSEGAVLLHRRDGEEPTLRLDSFDEDDIEVAGDQIQRAFAARAWLSAAKRTKLLAARLAVASSMRIETDLAKRRHAVVIADGIRQAVDAPGYSADVVASLDGRATLAATVAAVARARSLPDPQATRLRRHAVALCRELLELGALRPE